VLRNRSALFAATGAFDSRLRGFGARKKVARPPGQLSGRDQLLEQLPALRLTILVGTYAQSDVLGPGSMTDRVRNFRNHLPAYFPLPHPSWRSRYWAERNPWFEADVLPALRAEIHRALELQ
jgi:hypothetical protein